jgi:hypothetical protein
MSGSSDHDDGVCSVDSADVVMASLDRILSEEGLFDDELDGGGDDETVGGVDDIGAPADGEGLSMVPAHCDVPVQVHGADRAAGNTVTTWGEDIMQALVQQATKMFGSYRPLRLFSACTGMWTERKCMEVACSVCRVHACGISDCVFDG